MAIVILRGERDLQRIVDAIIQLTQGRQNSVGQATLAVGQTSTVVNFTNCSSGCVVLIGGRNAAAITAAMQDVQPADISNGSFVVRHNAAGAGAKFSFVCIGG